MTPEQESELFTTLGRLEQKMDGLADTLLTHTEQDAANFLKMEAQLDDVRNRQIREVEGKIAALNLVAAEKKGADEAMAKVASTSGGTWGAFTGGFISIVVAAAAAYFGR